MLNILWFQVNKVEGINILYTNNLYRIIINLIKKNNIKYLKIRIEEKLLYFCLKKKRVLHDL